MKTYVERVAELIAEGLTNGDAQAIADMEFAPVAIKQLPGRADQISEILISMGVEEDWARDYDPEWLEDMDLNNSPLWEQVYWSLGLYAEYKGL